MTGKISKLVLATGNKNKIIEIQNLMKNCNIEIIGIDKFDSTFSPEENGITFAENAYIKAYEAAKISNMPSLTDDSGLVIDALGGMPGVYSSRYAENDTKRIERVLSELKNVQQDQRTARFVCNMVIVEPSGDVLYQYEGTCEGIIIAKPSGNNGFGYDPIFYIPEKGVTMAELSLDEKNIISHRGKALENIINWLCAI